jgi:flagellar protein FliS
MWHNAHNAYLESRVLSAGPIELVRLLYQAATDALREARRHLEAGQVRERSRAISKGSEVLLELMAALDFERGGEIAQRLAQLYDYMLRRLTEANFKQTDAPLAEVLGLLTTLDEGWAAIGQTPQPEAAEPDRQWTRTPFPPETAAASSSQAWSF